MVGTPTDTRLTGNAATTTGLADTRWLDAVLRQFVRDEDLVEDLRQETLTVALRHPQCANRPWLARVARNLALSLLRTQSRNRRHQRRIATERFADPAVDIVAEAEMRRGAVEALLELDEPYRSAILLRYMKGQSPPEIAKTLDVPVETVRTRLKRGLSLLRTRLDRRPGGRLGLVLPLAAPGWLGLSTTSLWGVVLMKTKTGIYGTVVLLLAALLTTSWLLTSAPDTRPASEPNPKPLVAEADGTTGVDAVRIAIQREQVPSAKPSAAPSAFGTGASLLIRTRWETGGGLAQGVGVRVQDTDKLEIPRMAVSNARGETRFDGLRPGKIRVRLARYVEREIAVVEGRESTMDLVIPAGRDVHGTVVDTAGQPVANAEILSIRGGTRPQWTQILARSDARGRFSLRSMHQYNVIGARAAGYATSNFCIVVMIPRSENGTGQLCVELPGPEAVLRGTVLDPAGDPLAGAWVKVGGDTRRLKASGRSTPPFQHLRTDERGEFAACNLRPGGVPVRVYAEGVSPWTATVLCEVSVTNRVTVQLSHGGTLEGRVLDSSGRSIPDAEVEIQGLDYPAVTATQSDSDGRYRLEYVPAGSFMVDVRKPGLGKSTTSVEIRAGVPNNQDITLDHGLTISGLLVDERDQPLAGWMVSVGRNKSYRTGKNGRFQIPNCTDQDYRVVCSKKPGFTPAILIVPGIRPREDEQRLVVPDSHLPSAKIGGRILDADRLPLSGARMDLKQLSVNRLVPGPSTAKGGRFETRLLPPGKYRLSVGHPNHQLFRSEIVELRAGETKDLGDVQMVRKQ
jgi:RNA polymerase sigma factor (sigma-70 family)